MDDTICPHSPQEAVRHSRPPQQTIDRRTRPRLYESGKRCGRPEGSSDETAPLSSLGSAATAATTEQIRTKAYTAALTSRPTVRCMITTSSAHRAATKSGAGKARRTVVAAATVCFAVSPLLAAPSAAADTPPLPADTHCAAGFALLPIASFPSIYDDFLHGQDLNDNQLVCSRHNVDAAAAALLPKFPMLPPGSPLFLVSDDSIVR